MQRRFPLSRQRFEQFRNDLRQRGDRPGEGPHQRRERSVWELVSSFLRLLHGHRLALALSLGSLTIATVLALIPPAATKFVVDYVLGGKPLPASTPAWVPRDAWSLLVLITVAVLCCPCSRCCSISGDAGTRRASPS